METGEPADAPSPRARDAMRAMLLRTAPRERLFATLPPGNDAVALTFDDGPHADYTPRMLDTLAAHGAQATFFVVGAQAAREPALLRRMAAEGHAVGHHSWSHANPAATSAEELRAETQRTRALIEDVLGRPAPLFRPPRGVLTLPILAGVWADGNVVALWNRDPKDYLVAASADLVGWFDVHPLDPGDIVLLHDDRALTAEALPAVLDQMRHPLIALPG